jgi:small-conductance mechanosensitive channel
VLSREIIIKRLIYTSLIFVGLLVSSHSVSLPSEGTLSHYLTKFLDVFLIILFCFGASLALRLGEGALREHLRLSKPNIDEIFPPILGHVCVWIVVVSLGILCLKNFTKIDIGPVLASLGLGGLAVALAAKDTVSNLFGAITVLFDKPFVIGDVVSVAGFKGTVETIRFRTTVLRTEQGTLVTIPNQKMIDSPIENLSRGKSDD